ncbi:unnamed protein product, partial [Symbiodinium sp. KB8]
GGEVITLEAQNVGSSPAQWALVTITVGDEECAFDPATDAAVSPLSANVTVISCTLPPGQGFEPLRISVGSLPPQPGILYLQYRFPFANAVAPQALSTSGGSVILTGRDFGAVDQRVFWSPVAARALERYLTPSSGSGSRHDTLSVTIPPFVGVGADLEVHYFYKDRTDTQRLTDIRDLDIGFLPPRVTYAAPTITAVSGSVPTSGGTITLSGSGFGSPSLSEGNAAVLSIIRPQVTVGGAPCPLVDPSTWTDTQLTCTVPPGEGAGLPVRVTVAGQASALGTASTLAYLPPTVASLSQRSAPTKGGVAVTITGANFGLTPKVLLISTRHTDGSAADETAGDAVLGSLSRVLSSTGFGAIWPVNASRVIAPDVEGGDEAHLVEADGHIAVAGVDMVRWSHTEVEFMMPAFQGSPKAVVVLAGEQTSVASTSAAQAAVDSLTIAQLHPMPMAISPSSGMTSECTDVFVIGEHFGDAAEVQVVYALNATTTVTAPCLRNDGDVSAVDLTDFPDASALDVVSCTIGGGFGQDLAVVVQVPGHISSKVPPQELVAPPVASGLTPQAGVNFSFLEPSVTFLFPPIPAAHGDTLNIRGENFGVFRKTPEQYAALGVDGTCLLPGERAFGPFQTSNVQVQFHHDFDLSPMFLRDGVVLNSSSITIVPRAAPGSRMLQAAELSDPTLTLAEQEGGAWTATVHEDSVTVQCADAALRPPGGQETDAFIACSSPSMRSGFKSMTMTLAGQTSTRGSRFLRVDCADGYYGQDGELCLECPAGMRCEGGAAEPQANAGFWGQNTSSAQGVCPTERQHRGACPQSLPCQPQDACTGNNTCSAPYRGERCALCSDGHYRFDGECIECPDNAWMLIVIFVVAALALAALGYIMHSKRVNLIVAGVAIDYFQALSIFSRTQVAWPPALLAMFQYLSAFNLNLNLTAPECTFDAITADTKVIGVMLLPVGAALIFFALHCILYLYKRCILGRRKGLNTHTPRMVAVMAMTMYYLYLYLTRTTLDVFNCNPTEPSDGKTYLEIVFVPCWEEGGVQMAMLPWAVIGLLLYVIGFPAGVTYLLRKHRDMVIEDQLLRARATGEDRATNPRCYDFRKKYSRLYFRFKPMYASYWICVLLARKGLLAFTFQIAFMLLVFFAALILHMHHSPFMSPGDVRAVLEAHASSTSAMAARVRAEMSDARSKAKAKTRRMTLNVTRARMFAKQRTLGNAMALAGSTAAVAQGWVHEVMLSYNFLETALLTSSILVALAGLMFSSERLQSD